MKTDVIIIGSGAAGQVLALSLAEKNCHVVLLSKGELNECSTMYAQGGIAAVMNEEDSIEAHVADTLIAGAGLCNPEVVRFVASNAKDAIHWLVDHGVTFTQTPKDDGRVEYHLTREGGHSYRRILHAADATGNEIESKLTYLTQNNSNITIFTEHTAVDLIKQDGKCVGVYVLDNKTQKVQTMQAKFVALATGGASKVYLYTSNPDCASGDGIAIAHRAGCATSNMEFNQFHPTCLYHPQAKSFLITEAVRGEGGYLLLPDGKRFMPDFDERAELAPRDVVARAIDHVMKRYGLECVYLDISHKSKEFILDHFPNVYKKCLEFGFDMTKSPLPVVPAAHYTCGGVVVDKKARTNLPNLYALGEVSCTGLHGANRMASNSLLECIVFARSASEDILNNLDKVSDPNPVRAWDESQVTDSDEEIVVTHNWQELRRLMWDYVGIVRTNKRLARAARRIDLLKAEIQEYYGHFRVSKNLLELRNLVIVADLIVKAAESRKENIGLHYNLDNCK
ncbi:MAG: L-aspartate oxidase [Gammaproteobacteria bacterium]